MNLLSGWLHHEAKHRRIMNDLFLASSMFRVIIPDVSQSQQFNALYVDTLNTSFGQPAETRCEYTVQLPPCALKLSLPAGGSFTVPAAPYCT